MHTLLPNLILLLIALSLLFFVALLWMRAALLRDFGVLREVEGILKSDALKRRNMVPLLLAGLAEQKDELWRALLKARAELQTGASWSQEWEFEAHLLGFLEKKDSKTLAFLEAKKDIKELSRLIEIEKTDLNKARQQLKERRKRFPYFIASAIFGFQKIPL